jgi:hypothetical protein
MTYTAVLLCVIIAPFPLSWIVMKTVDYLKKGWDTKRQTRR